MFYKQHPCFFLRVRRRCCALKKKNRKISDLNKQDVSGHICLVTISSNRVVLEKIREFLQSQLDEYSYILGSCTKLINIYDKIKGNSKPIFILEISQIDYLSNILIPFLDTLELKNIKTIWTLQL